MAVVLFVGRNLMTFGKKLIISIPVHWVAGITRIIVSFYATSAMDMFIMKVDSSPVLWHPSPTSAISGVELDSNRECEISFPGSEIDPAGLVRNLH